MSKEDLLVLMLIGLFLVDAGWGIYKFIERILQ
jgi:hypothetical protein